MLVCMYEWVCVWVWVWVSVCVCVSVCFDLLLYLLVPFFLPLFVVSLLCMFYKFNSVWTIRTLVSTLTISHITTHTHTHVKPNSFTNVHHNICHTLIWSTHTPRTMSFVPPSDLRQLMRGKAALQGKKIKHPLAKYSGTGHLTCIVCTCVVKSDALWPVHLQSRKHKQVCSASECAVCVYVQGVHTCVFVCVDLPFNSHSPTPTLTHTHTHTPERRHV